MEVSERDPGPLARFVALTGEASTPDVIVQRLSCGESLRQIADAWGVPYRRLLAWIASQGDLSEQCKRVRELAGTELRFEGLEIIDEATAMDVAVAKERALYRERLSRDLNRPLFGKQSVMKHEVTFDLGERLRRARERVVDQEPELVTTGTATPPAGGTAGAPAPAAVQDVSEAELI